jgi:hypothetical protein
MLKELTAWSRSKIDLPKACCKDRMQSLVILTSISQQQNGFPSQSRTMCNIETNKQNIYLALTN